MFYIRFSLSKRRRKLLYSVLPCFWKKVCAFFSCYYHSHALGTVGVWLVANSRSCGQQGVPKEFLILIDWCADHLSSAVSLKCDTRLLPLSYGLLLVILALFKATEHWKLNGLHGSRLVFILIKDQAVYFLV